MALRPEFVHYLTNSFTEFYVDDFCRAQKASGNRIDVFLTSTDLGTQTGPMISHQTFREFVKPYLKRLANTAHELKAALFGKMIEGFTEK